MLCRSNMGWTYRKGGGNIDWYYIPPGGKTPSRSNNAVLNKDYFISEEPLKTYIRETHNWNGESNVAELVPKDFHLADFDTSWQKLEYVLIYFILYFMLIYFVIPGIMGGNITRLLRRFMFL